MTNPQYKQEYCKAIVLALRDEGVFTMEHEKCKAPEWEGGWTYYDTTVVFTDSSPGISCVGDTIDDNILAIYESLKERGLTPPDEDAYDLVDEGLVE